MKLKRINISSDVPSWFKLRASRCRNCKLCETRRQVVLGRGDVPATILFMGEAPGKTEDLLGQAFIGPSGKLLDAMIGDAKNIIEREERKSVSLPNYYITNTVLCRPTNEKQGENRAPENLEVIACMPNIANIVSFVKPKIVVFVGKVAQKFYEKEFKNYSVGIMHPAFILRQGGKQSPYYMQSVRTLADALKPLVS